MNKIKPTDIDATGQDDGKVLQVSGGAVSYGTPSAGPRIGSMNSTTTTTINWANFDQMHINVENNCTLNMTGATNGQRMLVRVSQNWAGGWVVNLGSNVRFGTTITSYTQSIDANKSDYLMFMYHAADAKYDLVAVSKGH